MTASTLFGSEVILFFVIGLLGGAHCIGMCGPLVTIYAGAMSRTDGGVESATQRQGSYLSLTEVRQHMLFNLGRAASYTLIGGLMGALGGLLLIGVDQLTATADLVRGLIGVVIGAAVIAIGLNYLFGRLSVGVHLPGVSLIFSRLSTHVERLANGPGILGLGAIHGLLPCPILYPAYLYAFATADPISGAIVLAALGLGTIPAVFAYGTLIESVDAVHRRRLHQLLGIAFVVLGYVLLTHGLMSLGYHVPHPDLPFWDPLEPAGGHDHH